MDVLYFLLPVSGVFTIIIVIALLWAVKSGQFDDLEGPAYRILMDDDEKVGDEGETASEESIDKQERGGSK